MKHTRRQGPPPALHTRGNFRPTTIIDGGYISWVYGCQPRFFRGWIQKRRDYIDSTLILMDSRISLRRQVYPGYKGHRIERREQSDTANDTYLRVKEFEQLLRDDPEIATLECEGYEADDLVAWYWLTNPTYVREVVAVDKDFVQVPQLTSRMVDHTSKAHPNWVARFMSRFPKGAGMGRPFSPKDAIVLQVAFGDKSDSIPRLYPVGEVASFRSRIWEAREPLFALASQVGLEEVYRNLLLALIPAPFLRKDYEEIEHNPKRLLELATSGAYWEPNQWPVFPGISPTQEDSHIMAKAPKAPVAKKVDEIVELWSQSDLAPKALRALRRDITAQFTQLYDGAAGELGEVVKVHGGDWTIPVGDQNVVISTEEGTLIVTGPESLLPYFVTNDETDEPEPEPTPKKAKAAPAPEPPAPKKSKKASAPVVEEEEEEDDEEDEEEEEPVAPPKKAPRRSPKA